jgi:hypothetical protein
MSFQKTDPKGFLFRLFSTGQGYFVTSAPLVYSSYLIYSSGRISQDRHFDTKDKGTTVQNEIR